MTTLDSLASICAALEDRTFERPPAIVCNAHITGLGVSRALAARDVPVIALDRSGDGVAPPSDAIVEAADVTFPLDDADGFRRDVERVAETVDHEPVIFGCMDEWVHAIAETEPAGVRRPFSEQSVIDAVLDKESLYALAEDQDVPYPETYRLAGFGDGRDPERGETRGIDRTTTAVPDIPALDPAEAAGELGFPLVVKPARKREFEELLGTNVVEVADSDEYHELLARAADAGVRVMAQEKVPVAVGEDRSVASYVSPDGERLSVVGNARVRYPRGYGTSCVVDQVADPELEERAFGLLDAAGYHGISEAEFVYDRDREEYVLLDVNTRPWKWIGMPVEAGANLPYAAYADAVGIEYDPDERREDVRWVYLRDYLAGLVGEDGAVDVLSHTEWTSLVTGEFESTPGLTTGVYRPSDPGPTVQLLETEFSRREYYCSC
ncbi:carboxylate--amine ligase [Halovivax gelatinilyticus]|uniref:carboxylate--amine ligase n=1 Tax=Halovivax gelatinilyticus TaxID=2961597 RepID=UPI0020CA6EC7|nr:carboxylate--amine ligase [Halovivax gelatinilyticus]